MSESNIITPQKPLPRRYLEPILFLGAQMIEADGKVLPKERKALDDLAEAAGMSGFRHEKWFKTMTEDSALERLEVESAKMGALVVLSLVLKADNIRAEREHSLFTRIRTKMGAEPITVPVDVAEHLALAMKYVK